MKKIPVTKQFDWDKKGSWTRTNPYSIFFVYCMDGSSEVWKGGLVDLEKYEEQFEKPCFIQKSYFYKGESRGVSIFHNLPNGVKAYFSGFLMEKGKRLSIFKGSQKPFIKEVKRTPRCFPREVKQFCEQ